MEVSAVRAGTETKYHFGDDESRHCDFGNHLDNSIKSKDDLPDGLEVFCDVRNKSCSDGVGVQTASVGTYQPNEYRSLRHAWQRVGVGAGLLERELPGSPGGRVGVAARRLFPARFARRLLDQRSLVHALREPAPQAHHLELERLQRVPRGPDYYLLNL